MNRTCKRALPCAIGLSLCGAASAQTTTLYGIVDQSIRYTTNASAANHGLLQLTNGAITNSRWGLKGSENLGGNLKVIFRLESGFDPQSGRLNGGTLFGRYAYAGLSGDFGTIKLGRQATEGFNLFGDLDPLTVGNYAANMWPYFLAQGRASNVVSYDKSFSGLTVGGSYGFGEQPGSIAQNAYWGLRAAYTQGALMVGAVYQETRDAQSNRQRMWGAAGRYTLGQATLFLGYLGGSDATGVVDQVFLNDPVRTVAYGSFVANRRKDAIFYTGAVYQLTPAVSLTGAFYYDTIRNVNGVAGHGGKRYTGVLEAEYAFSKRTQLYGTVDYNKVSGGAMTELPGRNNQTGIAIGLRHVF